MFVAIVGTRFAGKSSVEDYLVTLHGFTLVRIIQSDSDVGGYEERFELLESNPPVNIDVFPKPSPRTEMGTISKHLSFLSMSPLPSPAVTTSSPFHRQTLCFSSHTELLDYVTKNWRSDFVTSDLRTRALIEPFIRRPFFLLVNIDAPLLERYQRSTRFESNAHWRVVIEKSDLLHPRFIDVPFIEFVEEDDELVFGSRRSPSSRADSLQNTADLVNIQISNTFSSLQGLHLYLDSLDLLHPEHLRPSWDAYFMTLASLASRRSNCMKRRVGAILVRENRVLGTGYNGTPRGLKNCNEGGCSHCNGHPESDGKFLECLCLHAEENALLEAGRDRVGNDCVLYCNTCPCLKCTIKIIQTGVKTVVYNLTYKVDDASASLFQQAGVQLRRFDPNTRFRLPPAEDEGLNAQTSEPDSDRDTVVLDIKQVY